MTENTQSDEGANVQLKTARIIEQKSADIQPLTQNVKAKVTVDEKDLIAQIEQPELDDKIEIQTKSSRKWLAWIFVLVLIASSIELALFIQATITTMDWLAAIWLVIGVVFGVLLVRFLFKEIQGLKNLKQQSELKAQAKSIADTDIIGRAEKHCQDIAALLPAHCKAWVREWQQNIEPHHNDQEILNLFEHKVMAKVDHIALQHVTKHASAASVMIAISPFALVDMLIVLWRNILMLNQVSQIYGLQLGYWARVKLIKRIFHTMLFAGASEILSDAGNYALGTSITGKLSTRVAQGLGAGVLTARVGLKAINQSRPLPFLSVPKPGLNRISKQLLLDLQDHLK